MRNPIKAVRHSLALRLVLLSALTLMLVMFIFSIAFGSGMKGQFLDVILPHLQQYQSLMVKELGAPPSREKALAMAQEAPMDIYIEDAQGQWSSSGEFFDFSRIRRWRTHGDSGVEHARYRGQFYSRVSQVGAAGNVRIYLTYPHSDGAVGVQLLALVAVILVFMASYYAIRRLFSPIKQIQRGVARIGRGELGEPIEGMKPDELGDLAGSINSMAGDIEGMLNAKRELLLAISHELRSPLTRARVSVELVEDSAAAKAIRRDIREMEAMISGLLETERLNQSHRVLDRKIVDFPLLAAEVVSDLDAQSRVMLEVSDVSTEVSLDEARVRLLLRNLLGNALRYNRDDKGKVELTARVGDDGRMLEMTVCDHGKGISKKDLPHLLEPFYRADTSRQRNTGGYGLGLYLCDAIVKAHGGTLLIHSEEGRGTTIEVTLDLQPE